MECTEVAELGTAVIDGQLEENIASNVRLHLELCQRCRNEFELQRLTKNFVARKLPPARATRALAARIEAQIAGEARKDTLPARASAGGWFGRTWRPAVAGGFAVVAFLIWLLVPSQSHHSHASPVDGDILHQTYNNFDGVLNGTFVPQIESSDPVAVKAFFVGQTPFSVNVPHMKGCRLVGGLSSQYNNEKLAHVVYKHDNDVIYMYQAKLKCVLDGRVLHLPEEAKRELVQSGWYFENHKPDCSLIVWTVDSTVCCAVADMDRERLLQVLREIY